MNERTTATTTTTTQAPYRKRTGGKPKYVPKRKVCPFCSDKTETIDYKDPMKLRRFISERAKIEPRRRTGVCARHQRVLASAIKRARQLALLPYVPSHMRLIGGTAVQTQ